MISIFDHSRETNRFQPFIDPREIATNVAGVLLTTILAFLYFAIGFAAGESPQPIPTSVYLVLGVLALAVIAVGATLAALTQRLPWLAAILTPLSLGVVFSSMDAEDDFVPGLLLGSIASALLLVGVFAVRGVRWIYIRRYLSRQATSHNSAH